MPIKGMKCDDTDVYKILLQCSPGVVIIQNTHGEVTWCNSNALLKFKKSSMDDVIGHTAQDLWPIGSQSTVQRLVNLDEWVIRNDKSKLGATEHAEIDGKDHLFRIDKIPYRNNEGIVAGVITFIIDTTEALEQHILKYNSDLIYHELRSGLGNIISILKNQETDSRNRRITD